MTKNFAVLALMAAIAHGATLFSQAQLESEIIMAGEATALAESGIDASAD